MLNAGALTAGKDRHLTLGDCIIQEHYRRNPERPAVASRE